jgi:hypothetical protein
VTADARTIAARLGIDETQVRRLQARGYLLSLPFEDSEIRERLFCAHAAYAAVQPGGADLPDGRDDLGAALRRRRSRPPGLRSG